MQNDIDRWYRIMWLTKGARFNAFRRVKRIYDWSSVSMIMFNVYIIGLNLLVFTENFSSQSSQTNITILNVILSIFSLSLSIYLNGRDFKTEFQSLHQSGKDIAVIYGKISLIKDKENKNVKINNLINEYNKIINKNEYNHIKVDYEKMILEDPDEDELKINKKSVFYFYYINSILIYVLLVFFPPIIIWFMIK